MSFDFIDHLETSADIVGICRVNRPSLMRFFKITRAGFRLISHGCSGLRSWKLRALTAAWNGDVAGIQRRR
jgi:hypothetical protein